MYQSYCIIEGRIFIKILHWKPAGYLRAIPRKERVEIDKNGAYSVIIGDLIVIQDFDLERFVLQISVVTNFKSKVFVPSGIEGSLCNLGTARIKVCKLDLDKSVY